MIRFFALEANSNFSVFGIFLARMGAVGCTMLCRTGVLGRGDLVNEVMGFYFRDDMKAGACL